MDGYARGQAACRDAPPSVGLWARGLGSTGFCYQGELKLKVVRSSEQGVTIETVSLLWFWRLPHPRLGTRAVP